MLIMITGTPGAGKSLYTVWEIARKVPGSTIEVGGVATPRRLLSNIKNLLLEHEQIDAERLNDWHTWAKPGDVIIFDEVQEVWRGRSMGSKVPDCIAALETHRHMGVDIVLVTQHPQLVDSNIRRLVNQHLHLRRVTKGSAMVYEWDHCSNVSSMKTAIQSKLWWHPKAAYKLYRSAQAHTKPTQRLPRVMWLGLVALAAAAFAIPNAVGRLQHSFGLGDSKVAAVTGPNHSPRTVVIQPDHSPRTVVTDSDHSPRTVVTPFSALAVSSPKPAGCIIAVKEVCRCSDARGNLVTIDIPMCDALTARPVHDLGPDTPTAASAAVIGDYDTLAWMARERAHRSGIAQRKTFY